MGIAPLFVENFSRGEYAEVGTPTLVVYGDRDAAYGLPAVQHLGGIPGSRVRVVVGAGHACYLDNPEKFHIYLLSFLNSL